MYCIQYSNAFQFIFDAGILLPLKGEYEKVFVVLYSIIVSKTNWSKQYLCIKKMGPSWIGAIIDVNCVALHEKVKITDGYLI